MALTTGRVDANVFHLPFAEQVVAADDFEFIERWWRDASPEYEPAPIIDRVKRTLREPGVALAHYVTRSIPPTAIRLAGAPGAGQRFAHRRAHAGDPR